MCVCVCSGRPVYDPCSQSRNEIIRLYGCYAVDVCVLKFDQI